MNWGLFLALFGFLLPLAHALRIAMSFAYADPTERAAARARLIVLLLLLIPISGKTPAMLYALTGRYGDISQLTESFMLTGWGFAHCAFTMMAVAAIDLFGAGVLAQLSQGEERPTPIGWRALGQDAGVAGLLLILAWIAAR